MTGKGRTTVHGGTIAAMTRPDQGTVNEDVIQMGAMETEARTPPLHAALDYRARRLLSELDGVPGTGRDPMLAERLTPTTIALLRWWCSAERCDARVDNFHPGQRQAIVHTVLAYELLGTDDPQRLHRLACDPADASTDAAPVISTCARPAVYRLRMAPGSGLRWVLQALLVWQWANHVQARATGRSDARFSSDITLLTADTAVRQRLQDAVLGPPDADGRRDTAQSSLIRHARLFLPPSLRAGLFEWLASQARPGDGDASMLRLVDDSIDSVAGDAEAATAMRMLSGHGDTLRIDLALCKAPDTQISDRPPIAEYGLERAIRDGAVKLPMLEPTQLPRPSRLRRMAPRRMGLRPQLSRMHQHLLRVGLEALSRRDAAFAALDPLRRPRMLVLCETPQLMRGVRRSLIEYGFEKAGFDRAGFDSARIASQTVIDTLPECATWADARICVIVVLRICAIARFPVDVLAPGLSLLWPEPDFAALRSENRERAVSGRAPDNLLDVLSIVDHPQCHAEYAALLRTGLTARAGRDQMPEPAGDLIAASLRADADGFDIAWPCFCDEREDRCGERLSDLSTRLLRARQSMPVRKCVYTHAGWSAHDSGLRRAFVECAEDDPRIESHCLLDPRRHGIRDRDVLLAQHLPSRGLPEALVRTDEAVYLVEFLPFCPARPPTPGPGERALTRWCDRTNALPAAQRQHRRWHRAQLQAPLFWSWKRSGGALSELLAALAGAASPAQRSPVVATDR